MTLLQRIIEEADAAKFERGNLKMVKMHIEGLKRMVTMRGGLDAIRDTNPMLTNLIFG